MRHGHLLRAFRPCVIGAAMILVAGGLLRAQQPEPACEASGDRAFLAGRPSPLDSVSLTVSGHPVKVCYSRPSARGRAVFGQLVEYGKRWRTGANEPTMLFARDSLEVAGVRIGPGRYILMTVPERDHWTVIMSTTTEQAPARMFEALTEVGLGRAEVQALEAPVEQFTIRGEGSGEEARLVLEWERTRAVIAVRTPRAR